MAYFIRFMVIGVLVAGFIAACAPASTQAAKKTGTQVTLVGGGAGEDVRWKVYAARRQTLFVKLDLPVIAVGTRLTIGEPMLKGEAAAGWSGGVRPYSMRIVRGATEGPLVEQLTGLPRTASDAGSFLVPLPKAAVLKNQPVVAGEVYEVKEPFPIYLEVVVPPAAEPGDYRFGVEIGAPGRAADSLTLSVEVADIALPTEPRVQAIATTTAADLARIYPETFGTVAANYLDRGDAADKGAVEQLDAMVKAARAQGVTLFVEDLVPTTRVDGLGIVTLDWDAYDRVMQPYMDGTAFEDRIPFPVWLAPVPPRRIRDSGTQLWQYIDGCAKHFAAKGWVGVPAFLHPALANSASENAVELERAFAEKADAGAVKGLVEDMLRLHMPREMLAVASPGAAVPHSQLWSVNDDDPRLPPAGAMGGEFSVRAWPWVCVARDGTHGGSAAQGGGVKGFVWRGAVSGESDLKGEANLRPLFVVGKTGEVLPTMRMTWLNAGLNDAALLGLLEQRGDAKGTGLVGEVLAAMVGRTGIAEGEGAERQRDGDATAAAGFLYAGWPVDRSVWGQVTPMLQRLLLASEPGTGGAIATDDPLYLAAKLWLARAHRPVARVAGFGFSMRAGSESDILDSRVQLVVENPVEASAEIDLRFANLPGDFDLPPLPGADGDLPIRRRTMTLAASAAGEVTLPLAGHVQALMSSPEADVLEITERHAGATLRLPVRLPIYRTHGLAESQRVPKLDGVGDDWPMDVQTKVFGAMTVGTRYLSRPDLLGATVTGDEKAATVRWMYDKEYLYMLAECPQDSTSDERNTEWPVTAAGEGERWWGSDGLQILIGPMGATPRGVTTMPAEGNERLVRIAFKPGGIVLVRTGQWGKDKNGAAVLTWREGPPGGAGAAGIKYGITVQRKEGRVTGYVVEAAVPRVWIDGANGGVVAGTKAPAWRVNVLRHRAGELVSSSWAGPVVDDGDVGMMGALVGE